VVFQSQYKDVLCICDHEHWHIGFNQISNVLLHCMEIGMLDNACVRKVSLNLIGIIVGGD
jgi:hypothetical protein